MFTNTKQRENAFMVKKRLEYDKEDEVSSNFEEMDGDFENITDLQDDIDQELDSALSEFEGDNVESITIRVYRPRENTGKLSYLFKCLPSELPILDSLRDDYGGGDFQVRIINGNKILRRIPTSVDKPTERQRIAHQVSLRRLNDDLLMKDNPLTLPTPTGQLTAEDVATIVRTTMESSNQEPKSSVLDIQAAVMSNMIAMKELFGGNSEQTSPISQLKEMMELKKLLGNDSDSEDKSDSNTNDVLVALINGVAPALAEIGKNSRPTQQRIANPKKKKHPKEDNSPKENDIEEENTMKFQLMYLCRMAKKGEDPLQYAQKTVDSTPNDKLDDLAAFLESEEDSFANLCEIHPPVKSHKEWFCELRELTLSLIDKIYEEIDEEAGEEVDNLEDDHYFKGRGNEIEGDNAIVSDESPESIQESEDIEHPIRKERGEGNAFDNEGSDQ